MDTLRRVKQERVKEADEVTTENVMDPRWLEAAGPLVHDGVRCFGCSSSPIVGRRLECDQCYDYNLCEDCHASTAAKQRGFFSVRVPTSHEPRNFTRLCHLSSRMGPSSSPLPHALRPSKVSSRPRLRTASMRRGGFKEKLAVESKRPPQTS